MAIKACDGFSAYSPSPHRHGWMFSAETHLIEPGRLPMAAGNRVITFLGPHKMELQDKGYPKLQDPKGRKIEHAVILKIITTNICGSATCISITAASRPRRECRWAMRTPARWLR